MTLQRLNVIMETSLTNNMHYRLRLVEEPGAQINIDGSMERGIRLEAGG